MAIYSYQGSLVVYKSALARERDPSGPHSATGTVASFILLQDDNDEAVSLKLLWGTVTGFTTAYVLLKSGTTSRGFLVTASSDSYASHEGSDNLLGETRNLGIEDLSYSVFAVSGSDFADRPLDTGEVVIETQDVGGDTLQVTSAAQFAPAPDLGSGRIYVRDAGVGYEQRFVRTTDPTANQPDVSYSYSLRTFPGDVEIVNPLVGGPFFEAPDSAVPGSTEATQQVVMRTTATNTALETAFADSDPVVFERVLDSAPIAPTLSDAAINTTWFNENNGEWLIEWDPSGYGGGTVVAAEWSNINPSNDPVETVQWEKMELTGGVWRCSTYNVGQAGDRIFSTAPSNFRIRVFTSGVPGVPSAATAVADTAWTGEPAATGGGSPPDLTGRINVRRMVDRTQWDEDQNMYGGTGEQTRIGGGQRAGLLTIGSDTNFIWQFREDVADWHPPRARGYRAPAGLTHYPHPDNGRTFVVGNHAVLAEDNDFIRAGLYMSNDEGDTYTRVIPVQNTRGSNFMFYFRQAHVPQQLIHAAPSNTSTMYCLIQQRAARHNDQSEHLYLDAGLYRSTDGGATWSALIAFPGMNRGSRSNQKFGYIWILRVHPTNPDKIYIGCESGLFTATMPISSEANFTRIRGQDRDTGSSNGNTNSGTLASRSVRTLEWSGGWCYHTMDHVGIYRSTTNDPEDATLRYNSASRPSQDYRIYSIAVSPVNRSNVWYFRGTRADSNYRNNIMPQFSTDGANSFTTGSATYEGGGIPNHLELNGENMGGMWPSLTNATRIRVDRGHGYLCTDGLNFTKSLDGWTASNGNLASVAEDNPANVVIGLNDRGCTRSGNFGRIFTHHNVSQNQSGYVGGPQRVGEVVLHLNGNNGWLVGYGQTARASLQLCRFSFSGQNVVDSFPRGTTEGRALWAGYDANGSTVYFGEHRSTGGGTSGWQTINSASGTGTWYGVMSASGTSGIVWGCRVNNNQRTWYRGTGAASGTINWSQIAQRSDNDYTSSVPPNVTGMAALSNNDELCYAITRSEAYLIRANGQVTALGLAAATQAESGFGRPTLLNRIVCDWNDPDIVYVAVGESGCTPIWRSIDGGNTWEDASAQILDLDATLASGITAGSTSFSVNTGAGSNFPLRCTVKIDNEFIRGTRSGDTFTSLIRGNKRTTAASHDPGTPVIFYPDYDFIPCAETKGLGMSKKCGTVVWTGRGSGFYTISPADVDGYTAAAGFEAGHLYNRVPRRADYP